MIHQHFMLVSTLTVAENVALGLQSTRAPRLDLDRVQSACEELSQDLWPEGGSGGVCLATGRGRAAACGDS